MLKYPQAPTCLQPCYLAISSHLQVTHESVRGRYGHSITATSLGPGLTEVLVFGGRLKLTGVPLAETTILRFGEGVDILYTELSLAAQNYC